MSSLERCPLFRVYFKKRFQFVHIIISHSLKVARSESATAMLVHFQKLFDVREPIGVCTRMSEVYCKLSQCQNVIRTLQSTLSISEFVCIVPFVIHNRL